MSDKATSVFILGCRGAGKTAFLSGLSILSRAGHTSPFGLVTDDETTARIVTDLRALAERRCWPGPTSSLEPLAFDLTFRGRRFALSILDYPGEDLLNAMETLDFEARSLLQQQIDNADYVLVMTDPTQDLATPLNRDPAAGRRRVDALVQFLGQIVKQRRAKTLPQIALVISKADLLKDGTAASVESVARDNKKLFKSIGEYALNRGALRYFAISACGALDPDAQGDDGGTPAYPDAPSPCGYEALFDWLSGRVWCKRHRLAIGVMGIVIVLAVMALAGTWTYRAWDADNLASRIEGVPLVELPSLVNGRTNLPPIAAGALDKRVDEEVERVERELSKPLPGEALTKLRKEVMKLLDVKQVADRGKLEELGDRLVNRESGALFNEIKLATAAGKTDKATELISRYRHEFPTGLHIKEVDILEKHSLGEKKERALRKIREIRISNRDSLNHKATVIGEYLKSWPDDPRRARINEATRLCSQLSSSDAVRLCFQSCGFSSSVKKRKHSIRYYLNNDLLPSAQFESESASTASTFDQHLIIDHPNWDRLRLELWDLFLQDDLMASQRLSVLRDLQLFNGKSRVSLSDESEGWEGTSGWITIQLEIRSVGDEQWAPVPQDTLRAYGDYINPGSGW